MWRPLKNTCKYISTWIDRLGDTNDTIETKETVETVETSGEHASTKLCGDTGRRNQNRLRRLWRPMEIHAVTKLWTEGLKETKETVETNQDIYEYNVFIDIKTGKKFSVFKELGRKLKTCTCYAGY